MVKEIKLFTEPEELLGWLEAQQSGIIICKEEAGILLTYMKEYGYRIGMDENGQMVRVEADGEKKIVESYSMDELVDNVSDWNYERLQKADERRQKAGNLIVFANEQAQYERLLEEEEKLDGLFEQTGYGKHLDELALQLAKELIVGVAKGKGLDECVMSVADCIREVSAEQRRR